MKFSYKIRQSYRINNYGILETLSMRSQMEFVLFYEGDKKEFFLTEFRVRECKYNTLAYHKPCMIANFPFLREKIVEANDAAARYFSGFGCGSCKHNRFGRGQCDKNTFNNGELDTNLICPEYMEES